MGQSLAQQYIHLIFGTKHRQLIIIPEIEPQLHAYIAGILKAYHSPAIEINSVPDHIHILFRLSKNIMLSKLVGETKKESSKWMKRQPDVDPSFSWQAGYGAFSVSSSRLEIVRKYIQNQKEHHKSVTFKEEMELFMSECGVEEYDELYFWR